MLFYPHSSRTASLEASLAPFVQEDGLPFAGVLTAQDVQDACYAEGVVFGQTKRSRFSPAVILWAFLSQVLGDDKSCRRAVVRISILLYALHQGTCSADTAAYCRARAKMPAAVLRRLALQVGDRLEDAVPSRWRWCGKRVYLVDGTTVSMPDTAENQKAFPQARTQKPGLGFPLIRMVVLLSLATTLLSGMAYGPYKGKETGESALFREILQQIPKGSIILADRHYCSYFMVALLQQAGVDVVFRMHQRRHVDFRRGRRLGADDHVVSWDKPERPDWMDEEVYARCPATLTMREVRTQVRQPGYRIKELVVATTLLDAIQYPKDEITDLYHERWHVELDIRVIKQSLGMESLRCKSPFMIEKELWAYWLGYNLVRKVSVQAALEKGLHPRQMSFTATKQAVLEAWQSLTEGNRAMRQRLGQFLLGLLGTEEVGNRPGRCEPRAIKRRPKPHALLQKPRVEARADLLRN